jgi:hypothetical protein
LSRSALANRFTKPHNTWESRQTTVNDLFEHA